MQNARFDREKLRQFTILSILFVLPLGGFVIPESETAKVIYTTLLGLPGAFYLFWKGDIFRMPIWGNWKLSLMIEAVWLIPVLLIMLFFGNQVREILNSQVFYADSLNSVLTFIVFFGLLSAPFQEYLFRGIIFHYLKEIVAHPLLTVLAGGFIFSLSHLWYPNAAIVYITFVLGVIWGYNRLQTNSLVGQSVSHAIIGCVGILLKFV